MVKLSASDRPARNSTAVRDLEVNMIAKTVLFCTQPGGMKGRTKELGEETPKVSSRRRID
jgi:hypothetical protein